VVETSLTASVRRYWSADAGLVLPNILRKRFDAEFRVRHADAPSIDYFGPGPRSRKENRSNYRREDNMLSGALTWRPLRTVSAGWLTGANWVNIGPGRGHASPSTDNRFSRALIPGLQQQSGYMVNGPFLAFDSRDWPGDPHRGSLLSAAYLGYWNFSHRRSSFRRLEAQAEHYLPLFNQTRVIALRARTELSFVRDADEVPFYLQPVLGGPDDLRGFDRFRFHDNNSLLVNAEYRWEVSPALDLAVFADAGKVFERPGLVGLHHLEASGGLGFRLKTRNLVVMRLDTAVSREGFRLWLQFSNAFDGLPLFR
jgi:outer membrane protein assembly factor BamA